MGTRCMIGKEFGDTCHVIYVHFDGYPKGVGKVLLEKYNTDEAVNGLIALGDRSTLTMNPNPLEDGIYRQGPTAYPSNEWCDVDQEYEYKWSLDEWWYRVPGNLWRSLAGALNKAV